MRQIPRQASSGGAAPTGSSDVTTPAVTTAAPTASGSVDSTGSQTSDLTTATTGSTSEQLSSSPSSASPSTSADLTTSQRSTTDTTSTSSTPSTTLSGSSIAGTTSQAPTSSSVASHTTSSASSFVPSSASTTSQPPASSTQQVTTTITSAYTTYVNGSQILTSTSFPSTIPELSSPSTSSASDRTAIIAGSAAGGTALIILILSLAFCVRRKRFKRVRFLDAITLKRRQARSRATLLEGEVLDDIGPPSHRYTDYETPWDGSDRALMAGRRPIDTPAPALLSRWPDNGSAFREDVWPPPNESTRLMDPLANRDDINIDLRRIVDDVMGPSHARTHFTDQSVSSVHRGSMTETEVAHSRTTSNASNAALLEAAGLVAPAVPISTAPVHSSPLAQPGANPSSVGHQGNGDT